MPVGWTHSYPGIVRKAALRRSDRQHWRASRLVARSMDLPLIPARRRQTGEVWAVFLVKNEMDILRQTIEHTLRQGVDRVLVVDNGSTDGTRELAVELGKDAPVFVGDDREPAYWQSEKMTHLARWAARRGADWVVPMDADEFWFASEGTLADALRSSPHDILEARLHNLFPTESEPVAHGLDGLLRFDHARHVHGKTALRAHPLMWLGMGNHEGLRPGTTGGGLRIAHVPWRSEEQYLRKVRQGAAALAATSLAAHMGGHWRRLGASEDETLREGWRSILRGIPDDRDGWNPRGPFSLVRASEWTSWRAPDAPTSVDAAVSAGEPA